MNVSAHWSLNVQFLCCLFLFCSGAQESTWSVSDVLNAFLCTWRLFCYWSICTVCIDHSVLCFMRMGWMLSTKDVNSSLLCSACFLLYCANQISVFLTGREELITKLHLAPSSGHNFNNNDNNKREMERRIKTLRII